MASLEGGWPAPTRTLSTLASSACPHMPASSEAHPGTRLGTHNPGLPASTPPHAQPLPPMGPNGVWGTSQPRGLPAMLLPCGGDIFHLEKSPAPHSVSPPKEGESRTPKVILGPQSLPPQKNLPCLGWEILFGRCRVSEAGSLHLPARTSDTARHDVSGLSRENVRVTLLSIGSLEFPCLSPKSAPSVTLLAYNPLPGPRPYHSYL